MRIFGALLGPVATLAIASLARAAPIPVRVAEGAVLRPFALSELGGRKLADGRLEQAVDGTRVTARLVFPFEDGSHHEETTEFTQDGVFRMVSHRVVQRGPAFKVPIDARIDMRDGRVQVRHGAAGNEKVLDERLDLPPDLANGIIATLLKNVPPRTSAKVSMLAFMPKPRLVELQLRPLPDETLSIGGTPHKTRRFAIKVDLPAVVGVLARMLAKLPPDSSVWLEDGAVPVFLRSEAPLFIGGPLWRIEPVSPGPPGR